MIIVKSPQFEENRVVSLIQELIPTAKQVSNIGAELSYILDHDSAKVFKDLFERLEGGLFFVTVLLNYEWVDYRKGKSVKGDC